MIMCRVRRRNVALITNTVCQHMRKLTLALLNQVTMFSLSDEIVSLLHRCWCWKVRCHGVGPPGYLCVLVTDGVALCCRAHR